MAVVHRTYARALFDAAKERGKLDQVRADLEQFVETEREIVELRELLRNPRLDRAAKVDALTEAVVFYGLVGGFLGFVLVK